MEPPEIPLIMLQLARYINRMPADPLIKRLRIAVTAEEFEGWRNYARSVGREPVNAIRAIPLHVEDHPDNPTFILG